MLRRSLTNRVYRMAKDAPRIQLLLTGNEIMSGDTVDSNSAMIAQRLGEYGLTIYRKVIMNGLIAK